MRKRVYGKQLSRNTNSRRALSRSLIFSFIQHGKIKTTVTKAKFVQPELEKLISKAKEDTLHARRLVAARMDNNRKFVEELFRQVESLSGDRKSGFTRIIKLPRRKGDNAQEAYLEWTSGPKIKKPKETKEDKKTDKTQKKTKSKKE